MTMINNNSNLGLNGLTKRVAPTDAAKDASKASPASSSFSSDSLVRTGAAAAAGPTAAAASAASLERLANAYDADPATFARNLAEQALSEVVALVG